MCLEEACPTYDSYKTTIRRMHALLKDKGFIILIHGRNQTYYIQNERVHTIIALDENNVTEALQEAGFIDIQIGSYDRNSDSVADGDGTMVATAFKQNSFA
jgi:methylase of polypeptide subunit release factors